MGSGVLPLAMATRPAGPPAPEDRIRSRISEAACCRLRYRNLLACPAGLPVHRACLSTGRSELCVCLLGRGLPPHGCLWISDFRHRISGRPLPLGAGARRSADRAISTGRLRGLPRFHLRPIDVMVCHGSWARPGFEGGFPLRCVQRLSRPHLATRRCGWRHNRYTRGASLPVLSY